MAFSKRFEKNSEDSGWVEIRLTDEEEKNAENGAREENVRIFSECIEDAKNLLAAKNFKHYQTDIISIAAKLFEKRASHSVYHKERRAGEKAYSNA